MNFQCEFPVRLLFENKRNLAEMEIYNLFIAMIVYVTCDVTYAQAFREFGSCPSGRPLLTVTEDRKLQCAWRCQTNADCLSFRFVNGNCTLFSDLNITSNAYNRPDAHGQCYAKTDVILCEKQNATIACSVDKKIQIYWAMYGEDQGAPHCSKTNAKTVRCRAENAIETVQNLCENKSACKLEASNTVFGDPCKGFYKYLHVRYKCM